MNIRKIKKIVIIAGAILFTVILFYIVSGLFLKCNKPVKSSYILLEDWASFSVVEDVLDYANKNEIDSIIILEMKSKDASNDLQKIDKTKKIKKRKNTYPMYCGGILGFEIPCKNDKETISFSLKMRGSIGNDIFSHFEIFYNHQLITTGFANKTDSVHQFIVSKNESDSIAYLLIHFDNDKVTPSGDRNLFVSDIRIDSIDVDSLATNNFFIADVSESNYQFISKFKKNKYYFQDLGYDSSKIKLVNVNSAPINKTLAYARGAQMYFSNSDIKSINVITIPNHSMRSYLNFKNCLRENVEVGCFAAKDFVEKEPTLYKGLDERVSLFITWIYWWFN